jgi:hypothetical protein
MRVFVQDRSSAIRALSSPTNLNPCQQGEWNAPMLVEAILSMLTTVCHLKKVAHRVWAYFESRLAYTWLCSTFLFNSTGWNPMKAVMFASLSLTSASNN